MKSNYNFRRKSILAVMLVIVAFCITINFSKADAPASLKKVVFEDTASKKPESEQFWDDFEKWEAVTLDKAHKVKIQKLASLLQKYEKAVDSQDWPTLLALKQKQNPIQTKEEVEQRLMRSSILKTKVEFTNVCDLGLSWSIFQCRQIVTTTDGSSDLSIVPVLIFYIDEIQDWRIVSHLGWF